MLENRKNNVKQYLKYLKILQKLKKYYKKPKILPKVFFSK